MIKGQDLDWNEGVALEKSADCVAVDANHPLYILYTSGTTGSPKVSIRSSSLSLSLYIYIVLRQVRQVILDGRLLSVQRAVLYRYTGP